MEPKRKQIRVLNNEYFQAKQKEARLQAKRQKRQQQRSLLHLICMAIMGLLFTYGVIRVAQAYLQIKALKQETVVAKRELKRTQAKNDRLKREVEQLKDTDYVQKIIRSQYFYSKDGETIYILPDDAKD
ncbi:septum formation initiator family protein [Lactobacillus agilis]|jgi:cell division protein DivIC|uniref:FtsB family cell division protein n=1 Tax=Ligilactobacillus agilis TaxID=1601 RepID=UPI0014321094|nr:septum formation initiator family protein [Ligilactobacillus agilis]MDK6810030.1 septum formation initiator family protein [Ligilactobacillus agilis]MDM8280793.1 septum formation initiator family protein [Ligilactobacillus agilis]MDY4064110.1 septum formation initiator family protein [Ligilactobacillus agilis]NJE33002.1 septum formation initiator family protein [Ligilactobacillus agilis]